MVQGAGFRVKGSEFRVWGFRFTIQVLGFRVEDLRAEGLIRASGLGVEI